MKFFQYISFLKNVKVFDYFYLNYFCESVIRTDHHKLIPYKNAVIEIDKSARIYIGGGDIEIGCDLLKKSREETRVRLRNNAVWSSDGGCKISYGSTIELLNGALLDTGYFTMNSFSTLVAARKIVIGQDVMLGREVLLYDSDFHSIVDENENIRNCSKPVMIGDHVWICSKAIILKGTKIGKDCVIGANSHVNRELPEKVIYHTVFEEKTYMSKGTWSRKKPDEEK